MQFTYPLRDARFAKRINRFLASVQIDGREEYAHVPNSGRMTELLTPGRPIKLRETESQARKTRYDLCLVDFSDFWVSIDARIPGILMAESIGNNVFPDLAPYSLLKREPTYRSSRFDLLLGRGGNRCLVETKSVTLVNAGVALFPDAPTARGARHILDLAEAIGEGYETWLVFICQRPDAQFLSPNTWTDPGFAEALTAGCSVGLKAFAFNCEVNEKEITLKDRIPVILSS